MFVTEVDSSKKKAVHDELARLLVQYLRQQSSSTKLKLLDVSATLAAGSWLFISLSLSLSLSLALVVLSWDNAQEYGTVSLHH